jgi:hypothetical protein
VNIFYFSRNVTTCARQHCDQHVVKMLLEYTQMLSCACRVSGLDVGYRVTHRNHPVNVWLRASIEHWRWLRRLEEALHGEWQWRFGHPPEKHHPSYDVATGLPDPPLPEAGWDAPPQCMPDEYKRRTTIQGYREFYRRAKAAFATWTRRTPPRWMVAPTA